MTRHAHALPTTALPTIRPTRCLTALACLAAAGAGLGAAFDARALPITVSTSGVIDFIQEYEYGTAGPLPPGAVPMLPLFVGAARVVTQFSYDPAAAVDLNPSPQAGQYAAPGTLTVSLPDIHMSFTVSGPLGLSVYTAGEFHVNGNVTGHAGNVGSATPFSASLVFYMPVANDSLPAALGPWTYGNVHLSFQDITPYRDIFIGVAPVPEPSVAALLLSALAAGFVLRRARPGRQAGWRDGT